MDTVQQVIHLEYCPDILHNGSTGQPKWETVKHFVENLKVNKTMCYRLSGGEPTYWKHFLDPGKTCKKTRSIILVLLLTAVYRKILQRN